MPDPDNNEPLHTFWIIWCTASDESAESPRTISFIATLPLASMPMLMRTSTCINKQTRELPEREVQVPLHFQYTHTSPTI